MRHCAAHKNPLTIALQHETYRIAAADDPRSLFLKFVRAPNTLEMPPMAAAAQTLKSTVEQFTTASNTALKDNIEKSLAALSDFNGYSKSNMEAVVASMTAAAKGAESIGAQTLAYSKKSMEDGVAAAKALSSTKSVQEAVEFQTAFVKTAMEGYMAELTKMNETIAASVKDSFKPINERVTAMVEKVQAAR
jgi:phasin family protein